MTQTAGGNWITQLVNQRLIVKWPAVVIKTSGTAIRIMLVIGLDRWNQLSNRELPNIHCQIICVLSSKERKARLAEICANRRPSTFNRLANKRRLHLIACWMSDCLNQFALRKLPANIIARRLQTAGRLPDPPQINTDNP